MRRTSLLLATCAALLTAGASARADILYGVDYTTGFLYTVSTTNAALTFVGNTGVQHLGALEFASNGTLYGFTTDVQSSLYTINPNTGAASLVGPLGLFVFEGALAFGPNGTAYGLGANQADQPQLFTINLTTGAATLGPVVQNPPHDINGLAYRSDGLLVALDFNHGLITIDPTTGATTQLGALTAQIGSVGGMASNGNSGYLATGGPSASFPGGNQLYSFNLTTGAVSLIGTFSPPPDDAGISGLALQVTQIPEPAAACLALIGLPLALYRRRARSA